MDLAGGHSRLKDVGNLSDRVDSLTERDKVQTSTRHPSYLPTTPYVPAVRSIPILVDLTRDLRLSGENPKQRCEDGCYAN